MPEPLAVAYVEVRPQVEDFRSEAERDVTQQLQSEPIPIEGQLQLSGLQEARREVEGLKGELQEAANLRVGGLDQAQAQASEVASELRSIGDTQVNVGGLDKAVAEAGVLTGELRQASSVDVSGTFAPLLADVRELRGEAEALTGSLSGASIGGQLATDLQDTSAAAGDTAQSLGDVSAELGTAVSGLQSGTVIARQFAQTNQQVAGSLLTEAQAANEAALSEGRLEAVRLRARRATSLGPLRLAGVGLGVGTALFAATQVVGQLSAGLEVAGDEASTFTGRMRNLAANALRGDVVGAFRALTTSTHEYSVEQLQLIHQTPALEAALVSMGQGAQIAAARLKALSETSAKPVPQFIQTAIARARAGGDTGAESAALESAGEAIKQAIAKARELQPNQRALRAQIDKLTSERQQVVASIDRLSSDDRPRGSGIQTGQQALLEERLREIDKEIAGLNTEAATVSGPLNQALERLFDARRENQEERRRLEESAAQTKVSNLTQRFEDQQLAADIAGATTARLSSLKREQSALQALVNGEKQGTAIWRAAATALKGVNQEIESVVKQIAEEEGRHNQQMGLSFELIEARFNAAGNTAGLVSALKAERGVLQAEAVVLEGLVGAKIVEASVLTAVYDRIAAINAQIESITQQAAAEQKAHAQTVLKAKDDLHQKLLDALGLRESKLQNAVLKAQLKGSLALQVRREEDLRDFYVRQTHNLDLSKAEREAYRTKLIQTRGEIAQLRKEERDLAHQQVLDQVSATEDKLQDQLAIARTTDKTLADDRKRLRNLIAFYKKQAHNTDLTVAERRKFLVKQKQAEQELRNLKGETEKSGASFNQLAFSFLTEQQGFASQLAGNLVAPGVDLGLTTRRSGSGVTIPSGLGPGRVPLPARDPGIRSPFQPHRSDVEGAAALREQQGQPASQGQMAQLLRLARTTNRLLGTIAVGVGHQEAKAHRALSRNHTETGVD